MLYAEVYCRDCDRLQIDLDAVLDAGHRADFEGECFYCESTDMELRVKYGNDKGKSYKTGPGYEVDHPQHR